MRHTKRLAALENAVQAIRGWRYYATNDNLEAAGWFIDCTSEAFGYRASLAPSCETVKSLDDLGDGQRANVVGRERINQDEREGYQVLIIKYTKHWHGAPADAL